MGRLCGGGLRSYLGNGSAADMEGLTVFPTSPQTCRVRARQESAEVIVVGKVSRGRDARLNNDTGGLTPFLRPCGQASHLAEPLQRPWHSTDEGPNLSGITRPRSGGTSRKRRSARARFSPLWRRAWGGSSGFRCVDGERSRSREYGNGVDCPGRDSGITLNAKPSRRASRREDKRVKRNED